MIFVLGSGGFVGSAIVAYLERRNEAVRGIDTHNYKDFIGASCTWFINANGSSNKRAAEQDPHYDFESNVTSVVRTFQDFKVVNYLHISTIDVYNTLDDPSRNAEECRIDTVALSRYGFHKWLAERVVERYAKNFVIFRLGGMIGDGMKKGPAFDIISGAPIWQSPQSEFLFLHTSLVAEYIWVLRESFGEIFNIVASSPLSLEDFAHMAGKPIVDVKSESVLKYRVTNRKACSHINIPDSRECVEQFLRERQA